MKRIMQIVSCVFVFVLASAQCGAAELIVGARDEGYIGVYGSAVTAENANVVVVHSSVPMPYTEDTSFAAIKALPTDKDGTVSFKFKMPEGSKSGYYHAVMSDYGTVLTQRFYYLNEETASAALTAFSSFDTELKTENGFTAYAEALGIAADVDDSALDMGKTAAFFLKYKPSGTLTAHAFAKAYLGAKLSSIICGGAYDIDALVCEMQNNSYYLDCPDHPFFALSIEEQRAVLKQLAQADISAKTFVDALEEARFLTRINSAETKKDFETVLQDFDTYLNLDTTDYQKLKSPEKVIDSLMTKYLDNGFSSVLQFKTAFADCVAAEKKAKSPSGGGGGGGGSSVTSFKTGGRDTAAPDASLSPTAAVFKDVTEHWGKAAIEALCKRGIVSGVGDGKFEPERGVTRAEFAKMAAQAFFADMDTYTSQFDDVSPETWYARCVGVLSDKKIVNGVSDGLFDPDAMMTRENAAVIIERAAKEAGISLEKTREGITFGDDGMISDYARSAVYTLYEAKLLNGTGDECFAPKAIVTRAEAVQLLYNMLQQKEVR